MKCEQNISTWNFSLWYTTPQRAYCAPFMKPWLTVLVRTDCHSICNHWKNPRHGFSPKFSRLLSGALEVKFMGSFISNKRMKLNIYNCHLISVRKACVVSCELLLTVTFLCHGDYLVCRCLQWNVGSCLSPRRHFPSEMLLIMTIMAFWLMKRKKFWFRKIWALKARSVASHGISVVESRMVSLGALFHRSPWFSLRFSFSGIMGLCQLERVWRRPFITSITLWLLVRSR